MLSPYANERMSQFTEVADIEKREALLFDDEGFSKSKLYFEGLQLLRVFSEWIDETKKDLGNLRAATSHYLSSYEISLKLDLEEKDPRILTLSLQQKDKVEITARCDDLIKQSDIEFEGILEQIRVKREMVESLRDSVRRY
jgi:hypothetical protein